MLVDMPGKDRNRGLALSLPLSHRNFWEWRGDSSVDSGMMQRDLAVLRRVLGTIRYLTNGRVLAAGS